MHRIGEIIAIFANAKNCKLAVRRMRSDANPKAP
jgi:hypothetical protein